MTICSGIDANTGSGIEIAFEETISSMRPAARPPDSLVAPGWVDIQVNGFAGVEYNAPAAPHDEIARSVHVLYSSGVTRFYPSLITVGPDDMRGALKNLS